MINVILKSFSEPRFLAISLIYLILLSLFIFSFLSLTYHHLFSSLAKVHDTQRKVKNAEPSREKRCWKWVKGEEMRNYEKGGDFSKGLQVDERIDTGDWSV